MRICYNRRTPVRRKDIDSIRLRCSLVKILLQQRLHAHIDGQIDVIADRGAVQCLIDVIIEAGHPHTTTEIIIILVLNT